MMRSIRRPMSAALAVASRCAAASNVPTQDLCARKVTALKGRTDNSRKTMMSRVRRDMQSQQSSAPQEVVL